MNNQPVTEYEAIEAIKSLESNISFYKTMIGRGVKNPHSYKDKIKNTEIAIKVLRLYRALTTNN
ncbi:MAG: hypothetical protein COB09_19070 [Thalassobium sp.]|nr:MAG: hypothetical protein COB09_19070 [Thalassobium sp.]